MPYTVKMRRNADGAIAEGEFSKSIEWGEGSDYWWREGNFACDCNREDTFHDLLGIPRNEDANCGFDKFTVLEIRLSDGTLVYSDD